MEALAWIMNGNHVKEEGLHIIIEGLVVQEQLGQDAELLTIELRYLAIYLEDGDVLASVNFISRWIVGGALALQ